MLPSDPNMDKCSNYILYKQNKLDAENSQAQSANAEQDATDQTKK